MDLLARRARAEAENWLGEIEGIDLTLTFLRGKRDETRRLVRVVPVDLGVPNSPALPAADRALCVRTREMVRADIRSAGHRPGIVLPQRALVVRPAAGPPIPLPALTSWQPDDVR